MGNSTYGLAASVQIPCAAQDGNQIGIQDVPVRNRRRDKPYGMKLPYQVSRPTPPGGLAEIMITAPISPGKRRRRVARSARAGWGLAKCRGKCVYPHAAGARRATLEATSLGPSGQGIGKVRGRCVYPRRPPVARRATLEATSPGPERARDSAKCAQSACIPDARRSPAGHTGTRQTLNGC